MPFDTLPRSPSAPLAAAVETALHAIPPAWPLAATVAVNPFLGQAREDLATAAARLARVAGIRVTMPRRWYAERLAEGAIAEADLAAALAACPHADRPADVAALRAALAAEPPPPCALPTMAELAASATGTDWPAILAERIGGFCAAWFDQGQALWPIGREGGLYAAWRAQASRELTPELHGLAGFCAHVAQAPDGEERAIARALAALGVPEAAAASLLHRLLMDLGGWAQLARQGLFEAERDGGEDRSLLGLLALRCVWEEALHARFGGDVGPAWAAALAAHAAPLRPTPDQVLDAILQEAAERAAQRRLLGGLALPPAAPAARPALQAMFCIDVRSEVFRRALESCDGAIRTGGFAGFFGLPLAHRRFGSVETRPHLPVLLRPQMRSCTAIAGSAAEERARIAARARRAWGRFAQAAVSSFAFVESAGLLHAAGLLRDSLSRRIAPAVEPQPVLAPELPLEQRIAAAEAVLRAMSLTEGFAPLVLLIGHGAAVANNPHASALACGACGGEAGDVSARLLAGLLNAPELRAGLAARGIAIPEDTRFLAGLHDTASDRVRLFVEDLDSPPPGLARAEAWLGQAGRIARAERARHLPGASEASLGGRGGDWAEVRQEWGLAGCAAFLAAPRAASAGRDLGGRVFLHDYDWRADRGFAVLELILTAPVVVASWIALQYYGSVVAPEAFGAGNKLLHNVVGGVGVLEGNGGALRVGLPWQSVHDGERLRHEPLRLAVVIAAPREAIDAVLARHPEVAALFDQGWLHLLALAPEGRCRRTGPGRWVAEEQAALAA